MKRFLSAVIAIGLLLSIWAVPAVAEGEHKSGLFTYELKGNGNAVITGFDWEANGENDIYVPRQIDGYNVTEIGAYAFAGEEVRLADEKNDEMSYELDYDDLHIELPGSIQYLARAIDYGFGEGRWPSATVGFGAVVILPDTITIIGEKAFFDTPITSITIPASVQLIGSGAFAGCKALNQHSVAAENSVYTTIDGVLYNKTTKELVSVPSGEVWKESHKEGFVIPDGIVSIGEYAFAGVTIDSNKNNVNDDVVIPASVTEIKDYAFARAEVSIGNAPSVTQIGNHAFEDGWVFFHRWPFTKVEKIGDYAFRCTTDASRGGTAEERKFPQSLQQIGEGAFAGADIEINDLSETQVTIIPKYSFMGCGEDHSDLLSPNQLVLPDGITEIGDFAFLGIADFELSSMPASLKRIGAHSFESTELVLENNELILPEGLESIGENAFYDSYGLNILSIPKSVSEIGNDICDRAQIQLQVETGSYAALYASENGYQVLNAGGEDTSWLNS